MSGPLSERIEASLSAEVHPAVSAFATHLAQSAGASAALFYGSNLRTGEMEGVLDFYLLTTGAQVERIWPRVSYHEWESDGISLRAKVATMSMETFQAASAGDLRDTTIWARFVQPSALVWCEDAAARTEVIKAIDSATQAAAGFAVALGPKQGIEGDFWSALFLETYKAEFRVEKAGREESILSLNPMHFRGLLPLALTAAKIGYSLDGGVISPRMPRRWFEEKRQLWFSKRRWGKPLNLLRLVKASTTFEGAARYAAWKVERHTGVTVEVTPWREKHPILAAPAVLFKVWRSRRPK